MWTVIYIANNSHQAESLKKLLRDEGLLVNIRTTGAATPARRGFYEIVVPESEAEEAHAILCQHVAR